MLENTTCPKITDYGHVTFVCRGSRSADDTILVCYPSFIIFISSEVINFPAQKSVFIDQTTIFTMRIYLYVYSSRQCIYVYLYNMFMLQYFKYVPTRTCLFVCVCVWIQRGEILTPSQGLEFYISQVTDEDGHWHLDINFQPSPCAPIRRYSTVFGVCHFPPELREQYFFEISYI